MPVEDSPTDRVAGPSSKARSPWHRLRGAATANPSATAVALYAIVAIAATVAAYYAIFSQFQTYDDEGTLLTTVRAFVNGHALYRDVYSPYGPFYYEFFGGFFRLTGLSVSTDASRTIVVLVWVISSGLYGLVVQRLTGRLLLGITGMLVAFAVLRVLIAEPMHPHGLATLLLAGFILLAVAAPRRRLLPAGGVAGALLGALLLTKINLGIFALAAMVFAAALTVDPLFRRRWIRWPIVAAFLAMPILIMARDLSLPWVRDFIAMELLAGVALIITAWRTRPRALEDDGLLRWLLAAVAGAVAMVVVVLAILLVTGPSLSDIYNGIVDQALRIRDAFILPLEFPPAAVDWGIAAVALAAITSRWRGGTSGTPIWPGLLRLAAGLTIWLTIAEAAPFTLNPAANREALPMVLAWVAAIPPAGALEPPFKRFLRVLLPALAIAEVLQTYPVAGSQMGIAAVTFVPVGALCVADGLDSLRRWAAAGGTLTLQRFGMVATIAIVALAGKFGYEAVVRPALSDAHLYYREEVPLALPDAGDLHLPAAQAETYEGLVALLHHYNCSTLVGYPSINSLYLWSSLEAPKPQIPGPWVLLLDAPTQQRIVNQLRVSPRPCAIRDEAQANQWLQGKPRPDTPLVNYIFDAFKPVQQVGEFEFLLPKRSA